jgi:hypothetical protein
MADQYSFAGRQPGDRQRHPKLELYDQDGALIASKGNWKDTQETEIEATGLALGDDREAAVVQALASGP